MRTRTFRNILFFFTFIFVLTIASIIYFLHRIRESSINNSPTDQSRVFQNFHDSRNSADAQMSVPIFLSALVIISFIAFGITLLYFYRQRYWNGIQKAFVNNLMHEFRTPVSVISIASKVLQAEGIESQPARLKQYAGIIKLQTDELQIKSSQVMDWALLDKKAVKWNKESVDINDIANIAISHVLPFAEERSGIINFVRTEYPAKVHADTGYLTQALVNLLDNSLKYGNEPEILVKIHASPKLCSLSVRDNGIGMDQKYFKHIFKKFYRIPTGNIHNVKGFGIGLNFVKKVVDAHNGRIDVNSVTGQGTEFTIHLPITN